MLNKVYFVLRDFYYTYLVSFLVKFFLISIGVKVGKNFFARRFPSVMLDKTSNITLGDNIFLKGRVELRAVKGASVQLQNDVKLDVGVRIVATNSSSVVVDKGSDIGCYSIFNCGDDFYMGEYCLVAGFCYFQTSDHKIQHGKLIQSQGYTHGKIYIGKDVWVGGGSFILSNSIVENGCIIGANSLVNKTIMANSIAVGSPAKIIGKRE